MRPSTRVEREHWQAGRTVIVGADAVGVASLSGPVVAAAVAWPAYARRIPGVRDSKMLSRAQRERLFPHIRRRALAVGIGAASVAEIDRINIYHATNLAMRRAICRVTEREHVLIDGLRVYGFQEHVGSYTAIVRGDAKCYSIAAASIVAKVIRDRLMDRLAARHPLLRLGAQRRLRDPRPPAGDRGAWHHRLPPSVVRAGPRRGARPADGARLGLARRAGRAGTWGAGPGRRAGGGPRHRLTPGNPALSGR